MAIYQNQASKRLSNFLENHLDYEDDGDAESGPHLSAYYSGPEWAVNLFNAAIDPAEYSSMIGYENTYENEMER